VCSLPAARVQYRVGSALFGSATHASDREAAVALCIDALCDAAGNAATVAERARPSDTAEWAYGEVRVAPFACLLREHRAAVEACGVVGGFVDIGSGAGRAVIAAGCLGGFDWCLGIEVLEPLHEVAEAALASCCKEMPANVQLRCADVRDVEWWGGVSVAFCNAVTWPEDLLTAVGEAAVALRFGARLLVVGRQLPPAVVKGRFVLSRTACDMDWAANFPVWVHERVAEGGR